jgi:hypothetical protein
MASAHDECTEFNHPRKEHRMIATPSNAPEQLFMASAHAGGWPKLGWCADEQDDDAPSCFDEPAA